jgi:hypothetical protein
MLCRFAGFVCTLVVAGSSAFADEPPPRFARDVQPLLKRHCLKCHGPAKREGNLNLSTPAGIVRGGKNGAALVPHDVQASLLWKRVAEEEMPPDEPLAENEKDLLKRWIAAGAPGLPAREATGGGADGKDHWAFQPLKEVPVPAVRDAARVHNTIDRFLQAALEEELLTLGPEADRRTLIRRVSFDLTGLPPTPDEIAAFIKDESRDAYAEMVERYLASPHYGERWGKYWLDAAGYADSNGYFNADSDRPLAWRYRDWVVRAFNRDLPFDRFVREQIAGDELAGPLSGNDAAPEVIELLEATHYLRNGQDGSGESDGNPDEVRADRYYAIESVIQNVTNSLFGLTIQCAKCHDHKFEPLAQRDYYQLQAVFAPAFNLQQWVNPNNRFTYASLPGEFAKWEAQVKVLDEQLVSLRKELADWVPQNRPRGEPLFADSFDGPNMRLADRWSNTAPGDNAPGGAVPVNIDSAEAPGLVVHDGRLRIVEGKTQGDSWVSTREKFDWTPDEAGAAIQVTFDLVDDRLDQSGAHAERIGYLVALHDFNDDSPIAGGNILIDGHPGGPSAVDFDYPGTDAKQIGQIGATGYKPGHNYGVRITHLKNDKFKLEHLVDFLPDGKALELAAEDLPDGGFGFEYCCNRSFVVDNVLIERFSAGAESIAVQEQFRKDLEGKKKPLDEAQQKRTALNERPGKIAWVSDVSETPPEVFLLERGDYGKPSLKVEPSGLAVLSDEAHPFAVRPPSSPAKTSGRRLAFAEWATAAGSPRAALLARVQVNRLWQHHFGTGIVATPDNLGVTGAAPSLPELVDWLANEFVAPLGAPPLRKGGLGGSGEGVNAASETGSATPPGPPLRRGGAESGWSMKHIHRLILNSAAYRQVGRDDERGKLKDPDNRLLWRFPVRRLDAEAIRDGLLAVSGDLDAQLGGPAVATKRNDTGEVVAADPTGAGRRRSIYLRQRRTEMVSLLTVFDAPTIVFNSVQRAVSTMPLQALALLNSEFVLERAKSLAGRLEREVGDETARLRRAYEIAWGRAADEKDLEAARAFLDSQTTEYPAESNPRTRAWVDFCQMLLASNEFLYVE